MSDHWQIDIYLASNDEVLVGKALVQQVPRIGEAIRLMSADGQDSWWRITDVCYTVLYDEFSSLNNYAYLLVKEK